MGSSLTHVLGSVSVKVGFRVAAVLVSGALSGAIARANDAPGKLFELLGESSQRFERMEASGVSYFSGRLAVVDDTINALFVFDARGGLLARIDSARLPELKAKFEDIAFNPESETFFAVGSHSGWSEEVLERQSVLYEFRLDGLAGMDETSVRPLPLRSAFEPLGLWKRRGMKIEGLAIDDGGAFLYVGLREPVDRARVYRVSVEGLRRASTPDAEMAVEFDAGAAGDTPYCISALTWDSERGGLLIATSTEDEASHHFLGNRLWFWADGNAPVLLLDRFDPGMKAEGLALGAGKLFIVYDNDQDDTGIPGHLRIVPAEILDAHLGAFGE